MEIRTTTGRIDRFAKAFAFLSRTDLANLKPGRYAIDGDDVFANVNELELTDYAEENRYEAHRDYIDIQTPLTGDETIGVGVTPPEQIAALKEKTEDCVLWQDHGHPLTLHPGEFAVFYPPHDAHAPGHSLTGPRTIRKIVVKIRAN